MLKAQVMLARNDVESAGYYINAGQKLKAQVTTSVLVRNDVESAGYYISAGVGIDVEMNIILQWSILDYC